ncbi:MAG TPA: tripartite tricarboxylate transporter substrate binding protein [Alphaproteobacteria bacterium]|nr:tripartite tricarboxylate transporter substrate binding protein [Alphaproteobacteria bacterium]
MKWFNALVFGVATLTAAAGAAAQGSYPNRYVKIIVPFTPGGIVDNIARVIGDKLQPRLGQPVIVENKAGAGGAIGTSFVAQSEPDGYTLLLVSPGHAVLPSLNKAAKWDPTKDFRGIAGIGIVPNVVVVHPDVPVKTLKELLERAKTHDVRYGTAGYGTSNHLSGELLAQMSGVKFTHVPYKGQPEAVTDLLGGQIEMMPLTTAIAAGHIKTGKLRPLAVTTAKRATALPDVPTIAEAANLPEYEVGTWFGLVAPAKVPQPIIERLSREVAAVLEMPEVQGKLKAMAMEIDLQTPAEFDKYVAVEFAKWAKVMAAAGITQK